MAITIKATTDPFYTPGKAQKNPFFDWTGTDIIGGGSGYYEQNPDAYWTRYLTERQGVGLADTSPYAQYVRSQYANAQKGFQASLAEDPTLTWQRYLRSTPMDFRQMFQRLNFAQRGENPMRIGGPARVIADL
jgi:hypothetical protein